MTGIPDSHPRAVSLRLRERLVEGLHAGVVTETGLVAHGRGEALDYLLGEQTLDFARQAIEAASAMLTLARHPVVTVNGNVAALAATELVELANHHPGLAFEVNVFHYSPERAARIVSFLRNRGLDRVLHFDECDEPACLPGLESDRRFMHPDGAGRADVVLVALEDGDRSEALINSGRKVIAIDLNPLSRTARLSNVTIVDELTRTLPALDEQLQLDASSEPGTLQDRIARFDNRSVLESSLQQLRGGFS